MIRPLHTLTGLAWTMAWAAIGATTAVASLTIDHGAGAGPLVVAGKEGSRQLVVTASAADGRQTDVTRSVTWSARPDGIATVSPTGLLRPQADGTAVLTALSADGTSAELAVAVEHSGQSLPVNFANDVVPVLTKFGCNGGGCHGKVEGQNGFKLSLLGFEPAEDYEHLVWESRGRRLFPAAPENSLLLLKATGEMPHGGGARLTRGSPDYQTLVRWIEQGVPTGQPSDPRVTAIEVFPRERLLVAGASQQLQVTGLFSDGSRRDLTGLAQFDCNQKDLAECRPDGLVHVIGQTGDFAVMIRFQEYADVFRGTIPQDVPMPELAAARGFVDELTAAKWRKLGLPPSGLCDDATFLRRATIDIAGRLPTATEVEAFLAGPAAGQRDALVDRLLNSPDYAGYFAGKWVALLRNKRMGGEKSTPAAAHGTYAFHDWVRGNLQANRPFGQWVGELVRASGTISGNPAVAWYRAVSKPQDQLQDLAQVFLGQRLQCAQCHHHPYEKWSQNDYYGFAAFFSRVGRKPGIEPFEEVVFHQWGNASAKNPRSGQDLVPTLLGSRESLPLAPEDDPRSALAQWLTEAQNPWFSRMLVNRYWKHFFGTALVEPEDDLRATNPATNPALLDALARHFTESGQDLKSLVRVICNSRAYQLTAEPNTWNGADRQNYSHFYPRRLNAEVLLDGIDTVTGVPTKFPGLPAGTRAVHLPDDSFNSESYFLTVFGRPDNSSACECERSQSGSLAQALHLLNSKSIQEKLSNDAGTAARLAVDCATPPEERVRHLYLTAVARPPTASETAVAVDYLAHHDGRRAFEDIIWALLNTKEFLFSH